MKVSLSVSGGLIPRLGLPEHLVDSDDLAEQDNRELHQLVSAAMACAAAPPAGSNDLLRDAQTYQITVRQASGTTLLEATDGDVPDAFAALRDWLRQR
jgi:hypothetical protein